MAKKHAYLSISEKITADIQSGFYKSGQKLLSEQEMAREFGVSRETFRSAIRLLEKKGFVVVKHGIGTFVTNVLPTIPSSLDTLTKITDLIKDAGLIEGDKKDFSKTVECEPEWGEKLGISLGSLVTFHQRIRTANNEPVVVSQNIIDYNLVGEAFEKKELDGSLSEFLSRECGVNMLSSVSEIIVPLHTDKLAQKLLIHPETTVLLMEQVHYNELNEPVMFSRDYFRNDIFQFKLRRIKHE